jgi:predicted nucleotide-binding protein (sugar kinase/HSP70/actin superfamily)
MKKINNHIANIIKEYGVEPNMAQVSNYCYKHYNSITGLPTANRDNEGMFPEEILEIVAWFESHYGYEYIDFECNYGY